jgi:dihydrofolate reductase
LLPFSDRLYITHIHHEFEGDTFFPETNDTEWETISNEPGIKNEKNPYDFDFVIYERKN